MKDSIKYIGIDNNTEIHTKKDKEKIKYNNPNAKISNSIFKVKSYTINKKFLFLLIILLLIFIINPIEFLKTKLNEKKNIYSTNDNWSLLSSNIVDSLSYIFGYNYYINCKNTMIMPTDGIITCYYDLSHKGMDIACENYQDNIYAAYNGYVEYIGYNEKYGNEILIKHTINEMTIYTYYANLSTINVNINQYVNQGQIIAHEGGNPYKRATIMDTDGHHLHFEVRKNLNPNSGMNPSIFIKN